MSDRNPGLVEDPLAVGLTRPAMRWGVTYTAIIVNAVIVMELFLLTKNLLVLSIGLPIHGLCMLVCAREPRWFELASLWAQTRLPALDSGVRAATRRCDSISLASMESGEVRPPSRCEK